MLGRSTRGPCPGYRAPAAVVRGPWPAGRDPAGPGAMGRPYWCAYYPGASWPRSARLGARAGGRGPVAVGRWPWAGGRAARAGGRAARAGGRGPGPRPLGPWAGRQHRPPATPGARKTGPCAGCAGFSPISHARFHVKHFWGRSNKGPLCQLSQLVSKFMQIPNETDSHDP